MITIQNYFKEKENIDWSKVPDYIKEDLENIELIIQTAIDVPESLEDEDIKSEINVFLKAINKLVKRKKASKKNTTPKTKSNTNASSTKVEKQEAERKKVDTKDPVRESTNRQIQKTTFVKKLMPIHQQKVLTTQNSEELDTVIKRLEKELREIPKSPQGESIKKSTIYAHYFYAESDWFITDIDLENNSLFGFVILNGDDRFAEAGYTSIDELINNGKVELDFYFKKDTLENVLFKMYPNQYPNPNKSTQEKTQPKKKVISKSIQIKTVDHYSTEYRLIRRFYNLIRLNKTATFRKIQLVYMTFQKAALDRSIRKTSKDAALFTRINKKVIALFDIVNPLKNDANIDFTDKKLLNEMETFVKEQKVNYAITLLKSFVGMQGYQPEITKVKRLLKRITNAIEKDKVTPNNRLYKDVLKAKKELEAYLKDANKKIEPKLVGLSLPVRSLCTNRIKCVGLRKDGKLNKGYRFLEGGDVIASKKKAV